MHDDVRPERPATVPRRWRLRRGLWAGTRIGAELTVRTARSAAADRVHGLAAEASFWTMLSLPPLLLALLGLIGKLEPVIGAGASERVASAILHWADGVFTSQAMDGVIRPLVATTLQDERTGLVSTGMALALWSGSAALSDYVSAITLAYDMDGLRSFWRTRLLSLVLYLGALVIGAVLLPLLVLGPGPLGHLLERIPGPSLTWVVSLGYWPVVTVLSLVALTTLYHVSVPTRTRWRKDIPGAVLALLIWIAGSAGLRAYLSSSLRSDTGPAAAPIAVLLFFFLTALAVLIGAELNATVDAMWPEPATQEGRRHARDRRAREGTKDGGRGRSWPFNRSR